MPSPDTISILGVPAAQSTTDVAAINPFAGATVSDAQGAVLEAFVVVQNPAGGTLSSPGFDPTSVSADGSTFVIEGTAAQITSALQQLEFVPTVQSSAVTTGLSLEVESTDTQSLLASAQTAVTATPAPDPLTIATLPDNVIPAVVGTGNGAGFTPFDNIAITDLTPNAMDAVTITLDVNGAPSDANGTLSGAGLTQTGPGVYQLATAAPATEQAELRALVLTIPVPSDPSPHLNSSTAATTTTATLQVSNGVSSPANDTYVIGTVVSQDTTQAVFAGYLSASTDTTTASQTTQSYSTTIQAVLDGSQIVYNQTFALPYSSPTVQAAIAQADADLQSAGATPSQPTLTGSTPTTSVTTTTTPTGSTEGSPAVASFVTFGPDVIGPSIESGLPHETGYQFIFPGSFTGLTVTNTPVVNNQTVTTTTDTLLSRTYTISGAAPTISVTGATADAVQGGGGLDALSAAPALTSSGGSLQSASVAITGGRQTGDALAATTTGTNIAASYDPATGVLTLSGADTIANYETVLASVAYTDGGTDASSGAHPTRTLTWTVNDGTTASTAATSSVTIDRPPTLGAGGSATYDQGQASTTILDATPTVADLDGDTIAAATISIQSGFVAGDALNFTDTAEIAGTYNAATGVLALTGAASAAKYRAALASVSYSFNGAGDPIQNGPSRVIGWDVSDGVAASAIATSSVSVFVAPTLSASATLTGQTTSAEAAIDPFKSVTVADRNDAGADTDTLTITLASASALGALALTRAVAGATLSGSGTAYSLTGTAATITTALASLAYAPVNATPNASVTTSFTLSDASAATAALSNTLVASVVDKAAAVAPVISGLSTNSQTTTSEKPVSPFAGVTISDANGGALETLTIAVSGAGGSLTGAGVGAGGVYTLTGTASAVTAELRAVVFTPTAGLSGSTNTTTFTLADASNAGTQAVGGSTQVVDSDPAIGTGTGDVHMTTYDGLRYDFQADGAFILTQSTSPENSFEIQIQTAPFWVNNAASLTTAVAARVGSDVIAFDALAADPILVNGVADTALTTPGQVQTLAAGKLIELSSTSFQVEWATGETLTVDNEGAYFNTSVALGPLDGPGSVQGLLGPDAGQANDIQLPDGSVLWSPTPEQLLGQYAQAWSITPGDSLFGAIAPPQGALDIASGEIVSVGGSASYAVSFTNDAGGGPSSPAQLILMAAQDFSGSVAGLEAGDSVDLLNLNALYSSIANVAGTGAAGTYTDVTITDADPLSLIRYPPRCNC